MCVTSHSMSLLRQLEEQRRVAFNEVDLSIVELTALTSIPHERAVFNWNVKNFKTLVDRALDKLSTRRASKSESAFVILR